MAILVCPLARVPHLLETRRPSHVISLLDPLSPFPHAGDRKHLRVKVNDIVEEAPGWTAPAREHVAEIIDFVSGWERSDPILIHCYAGISRSTATAFVTACVHNPGCDEEEIALALRAASPAAWPNRRIVALADAELGRGGRMLRAIETIGPGRLWEDMGDNFPFELTSVFSAP
jgi:predicted protein tyrosine phosphatase